MKLRTKLLMAYLNELEREGKWVKGKDVLVAVIEDIKVMEAAANEYSDAGKDSF